MSNPENKESTTVLVTRCLDRLSLDDPKAVDDLFQYTQRRLMAQVDRQFQRYQALSPFVDAEDVYSKMYELLRKAVLETKPKTALDFFRLASEHIRRRLEDLRRKYEAERKHRVDLQVGGGGSDSVVIHDPIDPRTATMEAMIRSEEIHFCIEQLEPDYRLVLDLVYWHQLTPDEIMDVTGWLTATYYRKLAKAMEQLRGILQKRIEESGSIG